MNRKLAALIALTIITVLFLASCSLAGDVTPPPGFENAAPPVIPSPTPMPAFPAGIPSVAVGAQVYAQNCTRCHGTTGNADGEMAPKVTVPIPVFAKPDLARTATLARWFSVITVGNLDRFMPPWVDDLNEAQRWDVAAYLYTLSVTDAQREQGKTVYEANCASCHGDTGDGQGAQAAAPMPSFLDQPYMAAATNDQFLAAITTGIKGAHRFDTALAEDQRQAVVSYVRALSFDANAAPADIGAATGSGAGSVTGTLTNGSATGVIPADQPVALYVFDNFSQTDAITVTAKSDGAFIFPNLDLPDGRAFIAATRDQGVLYTSDVASVQAGSSTYDLPLSIYETTADASNISIDRAHIIFDFSPGGTVRVAELFIVSNIGDRTIVPATENGPVLRFPLPSGYTNLVFQDGALGDRYQLTDDGFADTEPVRPGTSGQQILALFELPYTDTLNFSQKFDYASAATSVLAPDVGVSISGANLSDQGTQDVQGTPYHTYSLPAVQAGDTVSFSLKGKPSASAQSAATGADATSTTGGLDTRSLLIGGFALALVAAGLALWWVRRNAPAAQALTADELLDEIASLDDGFEAGEYPEADYRREREKLKAQLKRRMKDER
ncbi:MAG: c-type cytochrome [Chloroflexi bacterium]|nr:c-type cytochrome [Chloroflexota bacterium]